MGHVPTQASRPVSDRLGRVHVNVGGAAVPLRARFPALDALLDRLFLYAEQLAGFFNGDAHRLRPVQDRPPRCPFRVPPMVAPAPRGRVPPRDVPGSPTAVARPGPDPNRLGNPPVV